MFDEYLAELCAIDGAAADAYLNSSHCTISFLTDTTSLKLTEQFLSKGGKVTADILYNIIIGQNIIPNWRKFQKLGPFTVSDPMAVEDFGARHQEHYPNEKAMVPKQLKQGVLGLLGPGSEIESCGRFVQDLAGKMPDAAEKIQANGASTMEVLTKDLGLPAFRSVMVARLLSILDPTIYNLDRRDIGDYAELGIWLMDGMQPEAAREAVKSKWTPAVDYQFHDLLQRLPSALEARDRHEIISKLEQLGLHPLAAQSVEHMLCEFRKMQLPEGRRARGEPFDGYASLWEAVAPVIASLRKR